MPPSSSGIEASSGSKPAPDAVGAVNLDPENVVLYGPPGSGKTTFGRALAARLNRRWVDTDTEIERLAGKPIAQIFDEGGETAFRRLESEVCHRYGEPAGLVIACGGGAMLDEANRAALEAGGTVVELRCEPDELIRRLERSDPRPLLTGEGKAAKLRALLHDRRELYGSFEWYVDVTHADVETVLGDIVELLDRAQPTWMRSGQPPSGYPIHLEVHAQGRIAGAFDGVGLTPPYVVVSDSNVGPLYGDQVCEALRCGMITVPAGEGSKTLEGVRDLYDFFLTNDLDRRGTVVALGGGVVLDMAGFAAATYMRGVRWAALPTSLLAMVDASIGGKVGVDLPQGKNLVGAFHPPAIVVADPAWLNTLPSDEVRNGMAEVIKTALISGERSFKAIELGSVRPNLRWIRESIAVKVEIVASDPFERGVRARLNLGHTFGHALEAASGFALRHGEAVSVGLAAAARTAERMGLATPMLAERVEACLSRFGLPTRYRGLAPESIFNAMRSDKKRNKGKLQFVLPAAPGRVEHGVEVPEALLMGILKSLQEAR